MQRWSLGVGLTVAALLGGTVAARAQEDGFLNRPLVGWIQDLRDNQAASVRRGAAFALGKMGSPAAIQPLRESLDKDPDPSVREASAFALGEIGYREVLLSGDPRQSLVNALVLDSSPKVRRAAACALGHYGTQALGAGAVLRQAVRDREATVRQNAAWALGQLGPEVGAEAVVSLRDALQSDSDSLVRRDAALALGKIGRDAHAAERVLLDHFQSDPDPVVRRTCLDALVSVVGPEDNEADELLRQLRRSLTDADPDVARNAAFALANIGGEQAAVALPQLREALRDPDPLTRRLAATALANIGPAAEPATAELTAVLGDDDPEVRRGAVVALGRIGPTARQAIPGLVKLLDPSQTEDVRKFTAEALANIDPNDPAVVAALLRVLAEKESYRVRHRVVWALARLENFEQPGVVEGLAETLQEKGHDARLVRYEAAKTLALKLGPRVPDSTLDVLLEALRDNTVRIYKGVGAKVSSSGQEARTGETQVKETGFGDWRRIVAVALARIGPRAKRPDILAGLEALSTDSPDEETRQAAKEALEVLKEDPKKSDRPERRRPRF